MGDGEFWPLLAMECATRRRLMSLLYMKVMLIDPGQFRIINELLQKECKGRGRLETLTFAATAGS